MTTKNKESKDTSEVFSKLKSSVNRLTDDVYAVKAELAKFKEAVSSDIQRLVELREKDVNEIRAQFNKK
jgi:predicted RNase H-like nuclease (RuvC/YqgF family)